MLLNQQIQQCIWQRQITQKLPLHIWPPKKPQMLGIKTRAFLARYPREATTAEMADLMIISLHNHITPPSLPSPSLPPGQDDRHAQARRQSARRRRRWQGARTSLRCRCRRRRYSCFSSSVAAAESDWPDERTKNGRTFEQQQRICCTNGKTPQIFPMEIKGKK